MAFYCLMYVKFSTQGTAGVAIAGLLGAVRAQGRPMIDFPKQKTVVAGAARLASYLLL
jgi:malic enzyme